MSYEFSDDDAKIVSNVGVMISAMALLFILGGIFMIIVQFTNSGKIPDTLRVIDGLEGFIQIVIGILLIRPFDNFRRVATTEGKDISELMTGITELSIAMFSMILLIVIILVLNILALPVLI